MALVLSSRFRALCRGGKPLLDYTKGLSSASTNNNFVFHQLFDPESSTYTYILGDAASKECLLIDPVLEQVNRDLNVIKSVGLRLKFAYHITGTGLLKKRSGCQTLISEASGAVADVKLKPDDEVRIGKFALVVRPTPGHTDGCVTYVLRSQAMAFTGDALLIGGCGRTDFQEGNPSTLYDSVHREIFSLPDHFMLYPAHDYKGKTSTTVGIEKRTNPRLTKDKSEFIEIMNNLNLPYPRKIDTAVPANRVCGIQD